MVLYHCVSSYHIIQAMVHRKNVHPEERTVLLMADFSCNKFADYSELKYFFDEIYLLPYRSIAQEPETIVEDMEKIYKDKVPYAVEEFDDIYVAAAHYFFSLYLMAKHVEFHYLEDGCGILSKPKVSYDIVMKYAPVQANIAQTYGMFDGENPYVIDRICNINAQSFEICGDNLVDFDLVKEMNKCGAGYIDKILEFFRVEKIKEDLSEYAIIFTQQLANLGIVSFEEQIVIYQLAIDFFLPDKKILFKAHPDDIMFYTLLFPESRMLEGRFPAELLPFMVEKMPDTSFTVFSSSVLSVKSAFAENIFCGYDFDKTFNRIDRYYFVLDLLSELNLKNYDYYGYGVDITMVENLLRYSIESEGLHFEYPRHYKNTDNKRSVIVIDDCDFVSDAFRNFNNDVYFEYERVEVCFQDEADEEALVVADGERQPEILNDRKEETDDTSAIIDKGNIPYILKNLSPDDIVVFMNTQRDFCFYSYEERDIFEQLVPVKVEGSRLRDENVYVREASFVFYVYSKSEGVKSMIKNYRKEKKLENSGIKETVISMSEEQQRIAILEGMLEATEKRLAHYIQKEKEDNKKGEI